MKGRGGARTRNQTLHTCSAPMVMQKCSLAREGLVQTYLPCCSSNFPSRSPVGAQQEYRGHKPLSPAQLDHKAATLLTAQGCLSLLPHLQCSLVSSILKMCLLPLLLVCIPGAKLYSEDKPPLAQTKEFSIWFLADMTFLQLLCVSVCTCLCLCFSPFLC